MLIKENSMLKTSLEQASEQLQISKQRIHKLEKENVFLKSEKEKEMRDWQKAMHDENKEMKDVIYMYEDLIEQVTQ